MQENLFEMSGAEGYDRERFIKVFINSTIAEGLDSSFDYIYWTGKMHYGTYRGKASGRLIEGQKSFLQ